VQCTNFHVSIIEIIVLVNPASGLDPVSVTFMHTILTIYLLKTHFNIILPSPYLPSMWSFSKRFLQHISVWVIICPHTCSVLATPALYIMIWAVATNPFEIEYSPSIITYVWVELNNYSALQRTFRGI